MNIVQDMHISREQRDFILKNMNCDVRDLALHFGKEDEKMWNKDFILSQIVGKQISKHKIPTWFENNDMLYPLHLSMEQASSEATARYKEGVLKCENYNLFVDLTGGLGVDFFFLSKKFKRKIYVEQNSDLCFIANNNFSALGLQSFEIENIQSELFLQKNDDCADVIYIDPARRNMSGNKVFRIEDCSPNILQMANLLLLKAKKVFVKYSPMLDISFAVKALEKVSHVYIISVENECKELLFELSNNADKCVYHAVNIRKDNDPEELLFSIENEQQIQIEFASQIENFLYEPNTSILKGGAFKTVAKKYGLRKLHTNSHLYTSDLLINNFQGRTFEVESFFSASKKNIKNYLGTTKNANISVRNFPMTVAEIRNKTKIKDGGNSYIFATTNAINEKIFIVAKKVQI